MINQRQYKILCDIKAKLNVALAITHGKTEGMINPEVTLRKELTDATQDLDNFIDMFDQKDLNW